MARVIRKVCQPTNAGLHRDQTNACRQDFVQRMLTRRGIHMSNKWKDSHNHSVKKLRHPYFFRLPTLETLISHPRVTCHYLQHPPAKARPQSSRPGAARLSSSGERHALQRRSRDRLLPPPPSLPSTSSWLGPPVLQNSAHGWALTPAYSMLRTTVCSSQQINLKMTGFKPGSCQQGKCYSILKKTTNRSRYINNIP